MTYFISSIHQKLLNYADDNTVYSVDDNLTDLLIILQTETDLVLKWIRLNEMKSNDGKSHLLIANQENVSVSLGNEIIEATNSVELLDEKIDKNLDLNDHVSILCKKGNQKLHAVARITKYLSKDKLNIIMKTLVQSHFNYCPLTWMFHNRTLNNKINNLHERALRIVYKNDDLTFQELLDMDDSITIHQRNLQRLATEMYKVKNKISPLTNTRIVY